MTPHVFRPPPAVTPLPNRCLLCVHPASHPVHDERCRECGQVRGPKHMETCPGPLQRIAPAPEREDDECDCPAGFHQRGCTLAYWPEDAA